MLAWLYFHAFWHHHLARWLTYDASIDTFEDRWNIIPIDWRPFP